MPSNNPIPELTLVLVTRLLEPTRPFQGTDTVCRLPQIGDIGTVVSVLVGRGGETKYIVECVDQNGLTLWLSDFDREELEPLSS